MEPEIKWLLYVLGVGILLYLLIHGVPESGVTIHFGEGTPGNGGVMGGGY